MNSRRNTLDNPKLLKSLSYKLLRSSSVMQISSEVSWNTEDIVKWMRYNGYSDDTIDRVQELRVTGLELSNYSEETLSNRLNIDKIGDRKMILYTFRKI